ncbi:MAG: hypothetical protein JW847_02420 [Candidatus Omnitrophica bacterium]|nr:hypothetical protein [Candidatus Omnitrophota bacterium]
MRNWKEKIRKVAACHSIAFVFLAMVFVTALFAQEMNETREDERPDLVIEEALDQAEKTLNPEAVGKEISVEPSIYQTPEVQIITDIPSETGSFEDIGEIESEDLILQEPQESAESGKDLQADEGQLNAVISVDEEDAYDVMGSGETESQVIEQDSEADSDELKKAFEVKVIPLLHAEASSMMDMLQNMKSPEGKVNYNEKDKTLILVDDPERIREMSDFIFKTDVLLETKTFVLENIQAQDIIAGIEQRLTENIGQAQIDAKANSITVTDTPAGVGTINEFIRKSDRFNVKISVRIRTLEIVLNEEHPEGVDWEAIVSQYQKVSLSDNKGGERDSLSVGTVSQEDYDILLEALDTVGTVRTLLEEGKVIENNATGIIDSPVSDRIKEGMRLSLTPTANKDASLEIEMKIGETGRAEKNVQMKKGETIVVGGIFKEVTAVLPWKIPLLGDIPFLGFVFYGEGEVIRKAEIITFLTVDTKEIGQ